MKILWLHEKLGAFGGAESNVLATAQALRDRGWKSELVFREETGVAREAWLGAFDRVHPAVEPEEVARRFDPDAVWIHNWPDSSQFASLARRGFPLGRMVHDHALYCMRHYKYHPLTRENCTRPASLACLFPCLAFVQRGSGLFPVRLASLGRKLAEIRDNTRLDLVVVASGFMRGELIQNKFPSDRIAVLPPVPAEATDRRDGGAVDFVPGRILYCGQVIRGKGVDLLLRALHGLEGDWHFALVGQGSALGQCREMISRFGLADRVTLHGHLGPDDLAAQYRAAQLVVVPSAWQEPFGMVGIEAMRHSRPVVAFGVGGIPDWLTDGENGILVAPGDVDGLRRALRTLLGQPETCRRLGRTGRETASVRFSFPGYIDKLEHVLTGLAQRKRPLAGAVRT
jgi:glycosyltransferase involved in cell wall biosynthesis